MNHPVFPGFCKYTLISYYVDISVEYFQSICTLDSDLHILGYFLIYCKYEFFVNILELLQKTAWTNNEINSEY